MDARPSSRPVLRLHVEGERTVVASRALAAAELPGLPAETAGLKLVPQAEELAEVAAEPVVEQALVRGPELAEAVAVAVPEEVEFLLHRSSGNCFARPGLIAHIAGRSMKEAGSIRLPC